MAIKTLLDINNVLSCDILIGMKLPDKKKYNISVHQFVSMTMQSGDLGGGALYTKRMQQGIQTHIKRQEDQGKISELPLKYTADGNLVCMTVSGRADIVDTSKEIHVIEEIKTLFGEPTKNLSPQNEHLAQCKCYCAMYLIENNLEEIGARIAYIEYDTSKAHIFEYLYAKDEILDWFIDNLHRIIEIFDKRQDHINKRNLSADNLKFPYAAYRAGQKEMATYVYKACREGKIQFLQAPTGIGKTMGTIYPAIKIFAKEDTEKIFYATAKNTIKQVARDTIDTLRKKGLIVNSITLTAKEKSCPQEIYNCHPNVCPRAKGYFDRLGAAMDTFEENKHYDLKDIRKTADKYHLCPFELSLDMSLECDIIICDFNNVYDPRAKLKRFFDEGGEYIILADEAHNLVSRAREMYSGEVNRDTYIIVSNTMQGVRTKNGRLTLKYINSIIDYFNREEKHMKTEEMSYEVLCNPLDELNELLEGFTQAAEKILDMSSVREYTNDLADAFYQTKGYLFAVNKADENYIHYFFLEGNDIRARMFCIDPSSRLQECHNKSRATIMFSASLTPFEYYARLLQKEAIFNSHSLPSPFDKGNFRLLVNAAIPVEYKFRERFIAELVGNIYTFVKAKRGKYLIFFPSYGYMEKAHNLFISLYNDIFAPKQERTMDTDAREGFISLFEEDAHMAAFAVMGGVFSEGIDLRGEKLIGAVIIGTGFPMISLENNFIKEFHNTKDEEGLGYAYIYPGFNKVLQAAGRVIRSEEDKGTVLLIDRRFARQEYQDLMPDWWKPVEYVDDSSDINKSLDDFWSE